jgi:hypothetical protein
MSNGLVVPFSLIPNYLPGGVPTRFAQTRPDLTGRNILQLQAQLAAFCPPRNTRANWFNVAVADSSVSSSKRGPD